MVISLFLGLSSISSSLHRALGRGILTLASTSIASQGFLIGARYRSENLNWKRTIHYRNVLFTNPGLVRMFSFPSSSFQNVFSPFSSVLLTCLCFGILELSLFTYTYARSSALLICSSIFRAFTNYQTIEILMLCFLFVFSCLISCLTSTHIVHIFSYWHCSSFICT